MIHFLQQIHRSPPVAIFLHRRDHRIEVVDILWDCSGLHVVPTSASERSVASPRGSADESGHGLPTIEQLSILFPHAIQFFKEILLILLTSIEYSPDIHTLQHVRRTSCGSRVAWMVVVSIVILSITHLSTFMISTLKVVEGLWGLVFVSSPRHVRDAMIGLGALGTATVELSGLPSLSVADSVDCLTSFHS